MIVADNVPLMDDSRCREKKSKFYLWILKIASSGEHVEDNIYYALKLANVMIDNFTKLPLTGNIMNSVFDSDITTPSSSCTKVDFRIVKDDLFKNSYLCWLEEHLRFL